MKRKTFKISNLILIEIRVLLCGHSSYQVVIPSVAVPDEDEGISQDRDRITRDADCILPASHARSPSIQITPIARNLATKAQSLEELGSGALQRGWIVHHRERIVIPFLEPSLSSQLGRVVLSGKREQTRLKLSPLNSEPSTKVKTCRKCDACSLVGYSLPFYNL